MLKPLKKLAFFLLWITIGFFCARYNRQHIISYVHSISKENILNKFTSFMLSPMQDAYSNRTNSTEVKSVTVNITPSEVLKKGDGIIFLETSDRLQPPPLVLCALESAARVYKDRPVAFFMKGLNDTNIEKMVKKHFSVLSTLKNIYFFPLRFEEVFTGTPLHSWYIKLDVQKQNFWLHVSADGCRLALIWTYGGIYMDTDFITMRPIPIQNFLSSEHPQQSSNGIFGFSSHHNFTQECLEDFVQKYDSSLWGQQGPRLFTRILKTFCDIPVFNGTDDVTCANITLFNPQRFYPISYPAWRQYYQVWDKLTTFSDSYGLHLWNYMNSEKLTMVPGSNTLAEHLYKEYCPSIYAAILNATNKH